MTIIGTWYYTPINLDGTNVATSQVVQHGRVTSFSQEARLEGSIGNRLKWVVGGNYQRDNTYDFDDQTVFTASSSELIGIHFVGPNDLNDQKIRDIAGFGSLEYRLTDTLILQGLARYTDEKRNFAGCALDRGNSDGVRIPLNFIGFNVAPGQCVTLLPDGTSGLYHASLDQHNTSWRGSLSWKPQPDLLLYANATKGFKAGSFATLPALTYRQLTPVTQESVVAYEAGFKASIVKRKVDLTGAAYYYDYRDKQIQGFVVVPPFGTLPSLINVPKTRLAGAELNITARPLNELRLTAGVAYISSKVLDSAIATSPFGNLVDIKNEAFPATPQWQLQGDAEYSLSVRPGLSAYLGAGISYRSNTQASFGSKAGPAGTQDFFVIKEYALVDLRAGVDITENYRIQVFGKNVTGAHYWNNTQHLADTYVRLTGFPTTYGISVSARF